MSVRTTDRSPGILRGPVFLFVVLCVLSAGCDQPADEERSVPQRSVTQVMNDHVDRLMALDEVVMVAVGELDDGTPCIQVYVTYEPDTLADEVGTEIEGHPVHFIVTDEIRPLN